MPPVHPGGEGDEGSGPEGEEELGGGLAFARGCDSISIVSIASSSAGSPRPRRRPSQEHEDTASLLSTGTLVPESIYLPPPGFQLVPNGEWTQLRQEVRLEGEAVGRVGGQEVGVGWGVTDVWRTGRRAAGVVGSGDPGGDGRMLCRVAGAGVRGMWLG